MHNRGPDYTLVMPAQPTPHGPRPRTAAIGLAILAVAAVARFGFLGHDSLWLDEVYSVRLASGHTAAELWTGHLDPVHPPLFYVILRGALSTLGAGEWAARLPSALASLLSVAFVFVLARNLGLSLRAATTAAILLALAPLDIWYAREARMYTLVAVAALVFAIGVTWDSWFGVPLAAAALAAGLFLDYTTVPLAAALIALGVARWWLLGRQGPALIRLALVVLAALWLSRALWRPMRAAVDSLQYVTFFKRVGEMTGAGWPGGGAAAVLLLLVTILIGIAAVILVRWLGHDLFRRRLSWIVWIGFAAATAALALPRAYSAKQILVTGWPFVVIAAAWSLTDASEPETATAHHNGHEDAKTTKTPGDITIAISLAAALFTLTTHRADWRGVVAYVNGHAGSGDDVPSCPCGTRSHTTTTGRSSPRRPTRRRRLRG